MNLYRKKYIGKLIMQFFESENIFYLHNKYIMFIFYLKYLYKIVLYLHNLLSLKVVYTRCVLCTTIHTHTVTHAHYVYYSNITLTCPNLFNYYLIIYSFYYYPFVTP